ncbi:hypothetical protein BGW36DRAFT_393717 [Talaromyces proteolyticus]|uniref:NAD(P)-binding domain-containing protein n=1 Tax=Talaromyces proteolyticus TaxID=1131652 RepID=A0AAD4Q4Q3_9EURO|nr:uncharacterized protein BGW36DRAFT_393717 [Talaromyces proteolyticus]KAH8703354.1 hypothetical protein BGW36DRAFT_393717 [Talaromyces proteolyticus]
MTTYAVLGTTGNCGTALIDLLLLTPDARVKAYCRNKNKLIQKVPNLDGNKRVQVYEGSVCDIDLLVDCSRDTRAIFHVVNTNDNIPGCHIGLDTAKSIIAALKTIKASNSNMFSVNLPKILLLSPAPSTNPRQYSSKPGIISVDIQRGQELNLDHDESFFSNLDLSDSMVEATNDIENKFDMRNVSVVNANGSAKFPSGAPYCIAIGILRHFFPFLHNYLPSTGPS